ncbi:MAG: hypothetical protein RLZZ352_2922 [Pseudomonadota bacterium]
MRHLLVINPNTSAGVTLDLHRQLQTALGSGVAVRSTTARFGAPYIADETSYAVATHATLDAWQHDQRQHPANTRTSAVLIGCFGDPGLHALRECCPGPVTGLAEAALAQAAQLGDCAIVTGGDRWGPMLHRICAGLPHGHRVKGIVTVALTGGQLRQDPATAETVLLAACQQAMAQHPGVSSLIIGGAALGGWAARLQNRVALPLIDSVLAGAWHAFSAAQGEGLGIPPWLVGSTWG